MAAGLPVPRHIVTHGHWTMNHSKMSKSRGNVADPFEMLQRFGVDEVRWFLMRLGGGLADDSSEHRRRDRTGGPLTAFPPRLEREYAERVL
jgi:methionyl-tRNA synthetase